MNKKLLIWLGLITVAGIGFFIYKKNKNEISDTKTDSETKDNVTGETEGEAKSESELVQLKKDYRVQKEISPVNYVNLNKSYYYSN